MMTHMTTLLQGELAYVDRSAAYLDATTMLASFKLDESNLKHPR